MQRLPYQAKQLILPPEEFPLSAEFYLQFQESELLDGIAVYNSFTQIAADYGAINEIYSGYFTDQPPARSAIQAAALPAGYLVEIEIVAARRTPEGQG